MFTWVPFPLPGGPKSTARIPRRGPNSGSEVGAGASANLGWAAMLGAIVLLFYETETF